MHPEFSAPYRQEGSTSRQALALIVVWSAREPHRVGEVALFPTADRSWVLGRNPMSHAPGMPLRMHGQAVSFFRQRPEGAPFRSQPVESGALIAGEGISRRQLEIRVQKEALRVKNIGRCAMRINGVPVSEGLVRPRDTIHLHNQIMFYCCWRPLEMPPLYAYPGTRASYFGEPDQDGIIGESPAIWELRERLALCASVERPVVIKGACRVVREQAERALSALVAEAKDKPRKPAKEVAVPAPDGPPLSVDPTPHLGIAVTEPRFHEIVVPDLNDRPEDIPSLLFHILRQQAHEDDLAPYFWMGLPRVHPLMIETLLHQHYHRHVTQLTDLAHQALRRRASGAIGPLLRGSKTRRRTPSDDAQATGTHDGFLPAAQPAPRRPHPLPSPRSSARPVRKMLLSSLDPRTLAMLEREGLAVPSEWEHGDGVRRGSRDS